MTTPDLELLMPFTVVYVAQASGAWHDSTTSMIYRKLPDGVVYRVTATSHTSATPTLHLSTSASASTRIASTQIPAGVENMNVKEVVVTAGTDRQLSVVGAGTPGDEITLMLIPMMITPP